MTELQTTIKSLTQTIINETPLLGRLERRQKDLEKSPEHIWKHGDVFKTNTDVIMMYFKFVTNDPPQAICIVGNCGGPALDLDCSLNNAKFLFNIKERL